MWPPSSAASEEATDEFCRRFALTNEAEKPRPDIATALIPRLQCARVFAGVVESRGQTGVRVTIDAGQTAKFAANSDYEDANSLVKQFDEPRALPICFTDSIR